MRVVLTGATGFIGRALTARWLERDDAVLAFSRSAERARKVLPDGAEPVEWNPGELGSTLSRPTRATGRTRWCTRRPPPTSR